MSLKDDMLSDLPVFFDLDSFAETVNYEIKDGAVIADILTVRESEEDLAFESAERPGKRETVFFFIKKEDISTRPKFGDRILTASGDYTVDKLVSEDDGVFYLSTRRSERKSK